MDEDSIIQGLIRNNNAAYQHLYNQYYPVTERFILQNNGTTEDAKDIFQETILVLHQKVQQENLHLTAALKTYIYAVSRNLWLKQLRKKRKTGMRGTDEMDVSAEEKIIEQETRRNLLQKLGNAFYKMTAHCKTLLVSMFVKNKSMATISAENGYKNIHTAQNQKYKCLEQARKEFKK
jgi:RNA polymerase sigma factor (sigma-70 family)